MFAPLGLGLDEHFTAVFAELVDQETALHINH